MIKELTENPERKFRCINNKYPNDKNNIIVTVRNGNLVFLKETVGVLAMISLESVYEEVKEPITFMDAMQLLSEGKTVYCDIEGCRYIYNQPDEKLFELKAMYSGGLSLGEILEGKWYIQD